MPRETEAVPLNRRRWLERCATALAGASAWPSAHSHAGNTGSGAPSFAATWQAGAAYHVGLLQDRADGFAINAALNVPTRAHGLLQLGDGSLLAVARRPGDWLLRWTNKGQALTWAWIEADRAFNGHVISSADGSKLFTTETNLDTGQGLIGVRDAASLEKLAEWPSHGADPHELLLDESGILIVANGGIVTHAETGRRKSQAEPMDSSIVRVSAQDGALLGQWRLKDPKLSLRHIAWSHGNGPRMLGIALQAEHAGPSAKSTAPVLALFDGQTLRAVDSPRALAGYGGDIASAGNFFAVSCPRAGGVAVYEPNGRWRGFAPLSHACALAARAASAPERPMAQFWAAGQTQTLALFTAQDALLRPHPLPTSVRLDNHWLLLP